MKQCECGCGSIIKEDRRFVSGHNTRCELPEVREKRIKAIKNRYDNDPGYKERQKKSHSLNPAIWTEEKRKEISEHSGLPVSMLVPVSMECRIQYLWANYTPVISNSTAKYLPTWH